MPSPQKRLLERGIVFSEPTADCGQVLVWAEGNLQRVERAVEGQLVARLRIARSVKRARVVTRSVREIEAIKKFIRRLVDCGEVRRLAWRAVPDRQLQLDADTPRARTAQRG